MKGKMLEEFKCDDYIYKEGQIIEVELVGGVIFNYLVQNEERLDLIPRSMVEILR